MQSYDELLCISPCNLIAISQNEAVHLKWDNVDGIAGYRVYMYDDVRKKYNAIKYTTAPEKIIFALKNNVEYRFKVKAYKLVDGIEVYSDFSESVSCVPSVSGFSISETFLMLKKAQTYNITCTYNGQPVDSVEYESSDDNIVSVDKSGTITALSSGEATIIVFSPDYNQSAEMKIAVERIAPEPVISIDEPRFHEKDGIYVNPKGNHCLTASIVFTGDMMCISNQQKMALQDGVYNFHDSFNLIRPVISDADFAIGTLETMLSESHPYALEKLKVDGKPNCNSPANFLDGVRSAGFDAVVTATNHSCDTELSGIEETLSHINRYHLLNLGMGKRYFIVEINGMKIAFFAYTMVTNQRDGFLNKDQKESILCTYSKKTFEVDLKTAKEMGAEFFIVMMHWGIMNSTMVREKQISTAKEMADLGADYIIGSHPHVLQKADTVKSIKGKDVTVIYSLGNLISSMREMTENTNTMILRLNLEKKSEGIKICSSQYIPCVILRKYKNIHYVTAPVLPEFCGYEGTNTLEMLQRIEAINSIANKKLQIVNKNDNVFKKISEIAPEAMFFEASCFEKEDYISLEWEQIEGADGYRIYGQNENAEFTGIRNSQINHADISINERGSLAFKIKAFRRVDGKMIFFRSSGILSPSHNEEKEVLPLFNADGYSVGNVIVLTWDNVNEADGYSIYKVTNKNNTRVWSSNINFQRILGLKQDDSHEFIIKAFRINDGQKEYFASSERLSIFLPYCRALPALMAETSNGKKINWIKDKKADGYRIYRENSEGVFTGITDVSGDEYFFQEDIHYRYKVKPYILKKSQRIYYNSSNVLSQIPSEQRINPLISFVVPEYNDEKYLERLFNSILSNTKINCEVIVVNDGSTDNSQKIIDQYCVNFPFVFKSIVKENGGVSKARNAGIGAARGKYIGFIDSDDSIRPETCELFERAILLDSDIIIAAYYKQEKNGNIVIQGKLPFEEYTKMDIDLYLALLYGKGHAGQAAIWNKLYRAELIKDKPIPSMKTEDVAWSPYIASYAQTFSYIDTPLYEYLRREGSTSDIINKNTSLDIFERRMKSINYFIENGNPQKRVLLYEIAKKRLEWHIKFTDDNSLYIQELDRLRSEHSNHESL